MKLPLDVFADERGFAAIGFLAEGVLYARIVGVVSGSLGAGFALQLSHLLACGTRTRFLLDASALDRYDVFARSSLIHFMRAHRHSFSEVTLLTGPDERSPFVRALVA